MSSTFQTRFIRTLSVLALLLVLHPAAQPAGVPGGIGFDNRALAEVSYVLPSGLNRGTIALGDMDTFQHRIRYGGSFTTSETYSWRVGVEWERFGFGLPAGAALPNTLNSFSVPIGNTWRVSPKWTLQFEADPGIYSDLEDIDAGDLNAPAAFRALYAQRPDLIWTLALIANPKSEFPFIGGVGVRWLPSEDWTVDFILPRPRVVHRMSDTLSLFVGGEFKGGGYRVSEDFGTPFARPELNDQDVFYREIRFGAGFEWRLSDELSASLDGGWVVDRRFEFPDQNLTFNGDGAGYFQAALRARF